MLSAERRDHNHESLIRVYSPANQHNRKWRNVYDARIPAGSVPATVGRQRSSYLPYYVTVMANAGGRTAKLKTDSKHYFLDQQLLLLKNNNNNIYVRFTFQTSYLRNQLHITPTTKSQKPPKTNPKKFRLYTRIQAVLVT